MTVTAILDTNVIISGIFWKGAPFEILKAWQEHRFRLAITLPILNEYRRVLDEMTKKHRLPVLSSILEVIELYSEMVEPRFACWNCLQRSRRRQIPGSGACPSGSNREWGASGAASAAAAASAPATGSANLPAETGSLPGLRR